MTSIQYLKDLRVDLTGLHGHLNTGTDAAGLTRLNKDC